MTREYNLTNLFINYRIKCVSWAPLLEKKTVCYSHSNIKTTRDVLSIADFQKKKFLSCNFIANCGASHAKLYLCINHTKYTKWDRLYWN